MKKINYIGKSKIIKRIVAILNEKAPLPLDGNGDVDWGTNGQVLTTDGSGSTRWTTPQGGGGDVTDVEVNGTSVVDADGVANITLGTAAAKDYTTAVTQSDNDLVTSGAVWSAIDNLPEPMIFKGTLGTGGTISTLPAASSANEGFTYKVITDGTYASQSAKVGDVFTSNGSEWVLIPAGDEYFTDTWRGVNVNGSALLGNGINTGAVNFKSGTNAQVSGSGNDVTVDVSTTFAEASTRTNIASGDTFATILGKIKKFFTDLKTVAFTGAYGDLSGTPTLATVATSGSYNDLSNKPTIPSGSDYVAKAGDTMTGELVINRSGISDVPLYIRSSSTAANGTYIQFGLTDGTNLGYLYIDSSGAGFYNNGKKPFALKSEIPTDFVPKSTGGTFDGSVFAQKSGESYFAAKSTTTSVIVYLDSDSNGNHGIWSSGYWNGSSYTATGKWLVYRGTDGSVTLNGHATSADTANIAGSATNAALATDAYYLYDQANPAKPRTSVAYGKAGLAYSDYTWLAAWNGYELRAVNKSQFLATSGGAVTGMIYASGTLHLGGSSYLNLRSPGIQCRNYADTGWAGISASSFTPQGSSRRYKENIRPLSDEEARKILEIETVTFDYKDGMGFGDEADRIDRRGVIAEDVEPIIPFAVTYKEIDGEIKVDNVDYTKFIPYLIKMVQMQQKEIDELKAIVAELKNDQTTTD